MVWKNEEERARYVRAAALLDDAHCLRWNTEHKSDVQSLLIYRWFRFSATDLFFRCIVLLHCLLAIFESPAKVDGCPSAVLIVLEYCFLACYAVELYLIHRTDPVDVAWKTHPWNGIFAGLIMLNALDIILFYSGAETVQWSRFFRPYYIVWHISILRSAAYNAVLTLVGVLQIVSFIIITILFYVLFCMTVFRNTEEGRTYFPDFSDGIWSLYTCLTTANYPDVMIPAYNENRASSLIFISFLVIVTYFLLNLVVATVYSRYRSHLRSDVLANSKIRSKAIKQAYVLALSSEGHMCFESFAKLFHVFRPQWEREKVRVLFDALDSSGDDSISVTEFSVIASGLNIGVKLLPVHGEPIFDRIVPAIYRSKLSQQFCKFVKSVWFEFMSDLLIVAYFVFTIVMVSLVTERNESSQRGGNDGVDIFFAVLLLLEVFVRVYANGARQFWNLRVWNQLDVALCIVSIFTLAGIAAENSAFMSNDTIQILILVRHLRVFRAVDNRPSYSLILKSVVQLIPTLLCYVALQATVYYFFAILGMAIYGGKISKDDVQLQQTDYGKLNYWYLSFNNVQEAFNLLFHLMVVNNFFISVQAFVVVTSRWSRLFFLSFYLCSVTIVLNVILAFTLEVFNLQYTLNETKALSEVEERMQRVASSAENGPSKQGENVRKYEIVRKHKVEQVIYSLFEKEFHQDASERRVRFRNLAARAKEIMKTYKEPTQDTKEPKDASQQGAATVSSPAEAASDMSEFSSVVPGCASTSSETPVREKNE